MGSVSLKYKSKSGNLTAPGDVDPGAMIPIATTVVGAGGASTVTFSSIPQNYEHLHIRILGQTNRATYVDNLEMYVNGDTGFNYSVHYMAGDGINTPGAAAGANAGGFIATTQNFGSSSGTANYFGVGIIDILDYANTNKYKTLRGVLGLSLNAADASGSFGRVNMSSGSWRNTNAISSITLYPTLGTGFTQYSSFALYGIKRAGA